jgi:hypothetical protein
VVKTLKAPPYKLLKGEVLHILNHVPTTETDLTRLVDYDEGRFGSKETWTGILKVIQDHLVVPVPDEAAGDSAVPGAERH